MKTNNIFRLLTLALAAVAFAFITSCEGPAGPAASSDPTESIAAALHPLPSPLPLLVPARSAFARHLLAR